MSSTCRAWTLEEGASPVVPCRTATVVNMGSPIACRVWLRICSREQLLVYRQLGRGKERCGQNPSQ